MNTNSFYLSCNTGLLSRMQKLSVFPFSKKEFISFIINYVLTLTQLPKISTEID